MPDAALEIVVYLGIIVAAAVVLGVTILVLRRRLKHDDADASLGTGFTLDQLAAMRDAGQLDDEHYQRLRRRVIERTRGRLLPPEPVPDDAPAEPPPVEPPQDAPPDAPPQDPSQEPPAPPPDSETDTDGDDADR